MNYLIAIITVAACFALASVTLDWGKLEHSRLLRPAQPEERAEAKRLSKAQVLVFSLLIAVGASVTMWRLLAMSRDLLNVAKLSIALVCLTGGACVDYVEHRIPNLFSGALALSAVGLLVMGFLLKQDGATAYVFTGVLAAAASTLCLLVGRALSHQGIGLGDIKIIAGLGLMGGVYIICGTLFFSMTICALVSGVLLLSKKKTIREGLPFGPFLLIGYILTICLIKF